MIHPVRNIIIISNFKSVMVVFTVKLKILKDHFVKILKIWNTKNDYYNCPYRLFAKKMEGKKNQFNFIITE